MLGLTFWYHGRSLYACYAERCRLPFSTCLASIHSSSVAVRCSNPGYFGMPAGGRPSFRGKQGLFALAAAVCRGSCSSSRVRREGSETGSRQPPAGSPPVSKHHSAAARRSRWATWLVGPGTPHSSPGYRHRSCDVTVTSRGAADRVATRRLSDGLDRDRPTGGGGGRVVGRYDGSGRPSTQAPDHGWIVQLRSNYCTVEPPQAGSSGCPPPSPWMARSIGVGGRPVTLARVKPIQPEPPERNRCSALRRWALTPARTVQSGRDVRTSCSLAGALPSAAAGRSSAVSAEAIPGQTRMTGRSL